MGSKTQTVQQKSDECDNENEPEAENASAPVTCEGNQDIEIVSVKLLDENSEEKDVFKTGSFTNIRIAYKVNKPVKNPVVGIAIYRNDGLRCYGMSTFVDRIDIPEMINDSIVDCYIKHISLLTGEYSLDAAIYTVDGFHYDYIKNILNFKMYSDINDTGVARIEHEWLIGQ
jgi:ABC-2 type transport system ATP-binding protein